MWVRTIESEDQSRTMYGQVKRFSNGAVQVAWEPYGTLPAQEGWTAQQDVERCPLLNEGDQGIAIGDRIYHIGFGRRGIVQALDNGDGYLVVLIEDPRSKVDGSTATWNRHNCVMLQRHSRRSP
jgi:hypothetical protein